LAISTAPWPYAVCLDDAEQLHLIADAAADDLEIMGQMVKVDLRPGPLERAFHRRFHPFAFSFDVRYCAASGDSISTKNKIRKLRRGN